MIYLLIFLFSLMENCYSQNHVLRFAPSTLCTDPPDCSLECVMFYEYDNPTYGIDYGIGVSTPSAFLHIRKPSFSNQPLYITEVYGTGYQSSIKHFLTIGSQNYGIYQDHSGSGTSLLNYFQDPVKIGKITIGDDGGNSVIAMDPYVSTLSFIMQPSSGPTTFPLVINTNGITVKSNLITDHFKLLENPGENKVLVSDTVGNGNWTDLSNWHDDDWLVTQVKNGDDGKAGEINYLYSNSKYKNIGIGTEYPKHELHIFDGNLLLSRAEAGQSGKQTATLYFGDFVTSEYPDGEWGIDYQNEGLDFWKVKTPNSVEGIDNFCLFLNNNGKVGIGTGKPGEKLEIAHRDSTGGILINQLDTTKKKSEIKFAVESTEEWAIGSNLEPTRERSFFIWNNISDTTGI